MLGRFGWAEILLIVVLVMILFGSAKIPSIMKNLADGINVFKKEIKPAQADKVPVEKPAVKKPAVKKATTPKRAVAAKKPVKKAAKKVAK